MHLKILAGSFPKLMYFDSSRGGVSGLKINPQKTPYDHEIFYTGTVLEPEH